jgi:hypothetical protein
MTELNFLFDESYKLHNAAKALEGFLEKLIEGKSLKMDKTDSIGFVFGKKDDLVRRKIKDKRLIAKTKAVWDFCRNDIMHYSQSKYKKITIISNKWDLYRDIIELMRELYNDFYGKSKPDVEIEEGFSKYISKDIPISLNS